MRTSFMSFIAAGFACTAATGFALAQDDYTIDPGNPVGNNIRFELGGGVGVAPEYEGSSDYEVKPVFNGRIISLNLGVLNLGGGQADGFSVGPSFRYLGERDAGDDPLLAGIPAVDDSLELGLRIGYETEYTRVFGQARYGVTGHNAVTGELGADLVMRPVLRPGESTEFSIGPRLSFGDDDYMDTYFSVPTGATFLAPYNASSGFKSAGVEATLRHDFSERWAVETSVGWNRLIGDAADSPIVRAGSEDQFLGRFAIIRKFDWSF